MQLILPDDETKMRIKNLSIVGRAISEQTNDSEGPTDVFLAKTSLSEFEAGILKLDLDPESLAGIKSLIEFLKKQIDLKMNQLD